MTKRIFILALTASLGSFISACTPAKGEVRATPNLQIPTVQTAAGPDMPDAHAAILEIIKNGEKANARQDALALTDAAKLLRQVGAKPLDTNAPDLAQQWKDTAMALQPGIKDAAFRGRVKGPAYRKKTLAAGAQETIEEIYYASEKANLTLETVSGGSLNISVSEQKGEDGKPAEPVCTLQTESAAASCHWLPLWTAKYNIVITNNGQNPIPYILVTN